MYKKSLHYIIITSLMYVTYTESDNAPARKIGSGHVRLIYSHVVHVIAI